MKSLLLLVVLGVVGYYAYNNWRSEPAAPPPPPTPAPPAKVAAPKPEPVSFGVKSRVRKLLEEWKRRSLGDSKSQLGSATIDPAGELTEIRKMLFRDGVHSEAAVLDVIQRALRELGVPQEEIKEVSGGILGMR